MNLDRKIEMLEDEIATKDEQIKKLKKELSDEKTSNAFRKSSFYEYLHKVEKLLINIETAQKNLSEAQLSTKIAKENYEREMSAVKQIGLDYKNKYNILEKQFLKMITKQK